MLDVFYASEKPLPRQQEKIYRLVGAKSHQDKMAVDVVLGEFWTKSEDGWHNKRADEEVLHAKEKSEKARISAGYRWHSERNANAMRTHSEGNAPNNQEPITKSQKPKKEVDPPAGVSPELWSEFKQHRGRRFTQLAETRARGTLSRLADKGYDPTLLINKAIECGWASFYEREDCKAPQSIKVDV